MLTLETAWRFLEMAEDLAKSSPAPKGAGSSIGFFCGFESPEEVRRFLPLDPPGTIRMKREDAPRIVPSEKMFSEETLLFLVKAEAPCTMPNKFSFPPGAPFPPAGVFSVTGELYPSGPCVSVLAAVPGSPYGKYALKGARKNPREFFFVRGK
ncbi:MAG: hypothetical protein J6331_10195 [Lentisphaeria bacterium]|nr:hypothetical protein [Lentisphaeria bacterium]